MTEIHPDTFRYANCTFLLRAQGQGYPRTCQSCGLGPCKNGFKDDADVEVALDLKVEQEDTVVAAQPFTYMEREEAKQAALDAEYREKRETPWLLGVAGDVRFRADDHEALGLFFTVWIDEGVAFGTHVDVADIRKVYEDTGITDFAKLSGRPCWYVKDNGYHRFKRFWRGKIE